MLKKYTKIEHSYLYKSTLIFVCFTALCITFILFNIFLSLFVKYDKLPFNFWNLDLFFIISIYLYFRFQYIICPIVILCFYTEKLIIGRYHKQKNATELNWLKKYQIMIFVLVIFIALFINILILHLEPYLYEGVD